MNIIDIINKRTDELRAHPFFVLDSGHILTGDSKESTADKIALFEQKFKCKIISY